MLNLKNVNFIKNKNIQYTLTILAVFTFFFLMNYYSSAIFRNISPFLKFSGIQLLAVFVLIWISVLMTFIKSVKVEVDFFVVKFWYLMSYITIFSLVLYVVLYFFYINDFVHMNNNYDKAAVKLHTCHAIIADGFAFLSIVSIFFVLDQMKAYTKQFKIKNKYKDLEDYH